MAANEALWAAEMRETNVVHSVEQLKLKAQLDDFALRIGSLSAEVHSSTDGAFQSYPQISERIGGTKLSFDGKAKDTTDTNGKAGDKSGLDKGVDGEQTEGANASAEVVALEDSLDDINAI